MKILYAASEAAPFIKVGGLGDVAGALPKALCAAGEDCRVILPFYSAIPQALREQCVYKTNFTVHSAGEDRYCGIFEANVGGVIYYLLDNESYFKREKTYGEGDDAERFAFFSRAVLEAIPVLDFIPDVLHCNDWHTALIPAVLDTEFRWRKEFKHIRTVFTIHNIEFQGQFDPYILGGTFGMGNEQLPLMTYGGSLNLMKGAIECANRVTTVSETYAKEIMDPPKSCGLEDILRARAFKVSGILNGIDTELFNPQTDPRIKVNYTSRSLGRKVQNKNALQKELGLPETDEVPLFGMVTRLTHQKGMELMEAKLDWLLSQDVQVVILGTGDAHYEEFLKDAAERHPENLRVILAFDGNLAQRIYAGCDIFLMPSKFEPCGLAQMIAMRYGTLPLVCVTGGLADTVPAYNYGERSGRGITFHTQHPEDFSHALWRAIELFHDKDHFLQAQKNAMKGDYSWGPSVKAYLALYNGI